MNSKVIHSRGYNVSPQTSSHLNKDIHSNNSPNIICILKKQNRQLRQRLHDLSLELASGNKQSMGTQTQMDYLTQSQTKEDSLASYMKIKEHLQLIVDQIEREAEIFRHRQGEMGAYLAQLERRNQKLVKQNQQLHATLKQFQDTTHSTNHPQFLLRDKMLSVLGVKDKPRTNSKIQYKFQDQKRGEVNPERQLNHRRWSNQKAEKMNNYSRCCCSSRRSSRGLKVYEDKLRQIEDHFL